MTNKNKNKIYGVIVTAAFHAVVLVLLLTIFFRTPLPLPGEAGVEVNLSMYEPGLGTEFNESNAKEPVIEESEPVVEEQPEAIEEVVEETIEDIVSEDEEIPSIEETVNNEDQEEEKKEEIEEKPEEIKAEEKPVVNRRALFQVNNNGNKASSEGITEGSGEDGSHDGLKDLNRYEDSSGSGNGTAYDLGGRGAKSISSPSRDFREEGKIVVDIWVNKNGIVERAEIGRGTTITDSSMHESAKKAALSSIFNKDDKANELQRGTITYTFIIRQ